MIECIFTVDYEIFGNGRGSLEELVIAPAERLKTIFQSRNLRFVLYPEVAELERIEAESADPALERVKQQLQEFHQDGFELGLHVHPWWYNAHYKNREWVLDYSEYNLCVLPRARVIQIIERAIAYYNRLLNRSGIAPFSYRAGHLLFQPAKTVAGVLAEQGVKVDSSVFKGGVWKHHKQDYRGTKRNGYYWKFSDRIELPDPDGALLELPIYTRMIPIWKMLTTKRIGLKKRGASVAQTSKKMTSRITDYLRLFYPQKFDVCSMSIDELTSTIDPILREDKADPSTYRPIVAIGHTKEMVDFDTLETFLAYLETTGIRVSTFKEAYGKCR